MSKSWPSTPLKAARRAFELLTCPPHPLTFDCRGFPDMPQKVLPLGDLRRALNNRSVSRPARDAVWRELVSRARSAGPEWVIATVGVAMPGLVRIAGMLSAGWRGDVSDLDAELLSGFLQRLRTLDLAEHRICGKLIDAGERAVKKARERDGDSEVIRVDVAWSLPPRQPWDHPDWVLARAVAAAVIDPEEHLLVSATRLEDVALAVVADKLGISVSLAAAWRRKAEQRLVEAITAGELGEVTLRARSRRFSDAEARRDGGPVTPRNRSGPVSAAA